MFRSGWTGLCLPMLVVTVTVAAAAAVGQDEAAEDAQERQIVERFTAVLERNPRRGTAFDKVYGYHVERGSLDALLERYRERAGQVEGAARGAAWMIVGLIETQRGRDAESIRAFALAEAADPASALASFHLGQALALAGQPEPAADAFERSIERQPAPPDLLEVLQSLGRLYQQAGKKDKALDAWSRLEKAFPGDQRVQEQIAATLLEEEALEAALPRFENLARTSRDKYRQSLFQVEAAEIKVRLGKTAEGLSDFEALLTQLNPEHWLYRDIRRRIEAVFQKSHNASGLVVYYAKWIEQHPDDLDAMSRLARLLSGIGRSRDAQSWLQRGLTLAPSNRALRLALINQLLSESKYQEAAAQYQELDRHEPNNPDTLREWGRVLMKDSYKGSTGSGVVYEIAKQVDLAGRQRAAAAVWRRLLAARPNDSQTAAQVADLFRQAEMTDDAIELYRRAIELAPENPLYREYLGEYLHSLKRVDEALATWREIASGGRRTSVNLARLAELLARNDQLAEAIKVNAEACRLDPRDLNLQLKQVDLLSRDEQHESALQQLAVAEKLAANDEERQACRQRELDELKALGRLADRIADMRKELEGANGAGGLVDAERWFWLAQANEVAGQADEALRAIGKAVDLNPNSVPILDAAARLNEVERNVSVAVEINQKLAAINRRHRTEYLKRIAKLEEMLGHPDQALQAGRELLIASPGNPEVSAELARMCFRLGRTAEGIQTLRRSLRINSGDQATLLQLAGALREQNQASEAVELLWRAFDQAPNVMDRLVVVQELAEVLSSTGQMNTLYIRLERGRRDAGLHREMTLCLARAYEVVGELDSARRTLESLLSDEEQDRDLLMHLRLLAERQRDFEQAIRFQRRLWKLTSHPSDRSRLVQLLLLNGESDEAIEMMFASASDQELTADALKMLDTLSGMNRNTELLTRLQQLRKKAPRNWELLYREGVALAKTSPKESIARFEAVLKLNLPDDAPSLLGPPPQRGFPTATRLPLQERLSDVQQVQYVIQQSTVQRAVVNRSSAVRTMTATRLVALPQVWTPHDYGQARVAAWVWLNSLHRAGNVWDYVSREFPEVLEPSSRQQHVDRIILMTLRNATLERCEAARKLAQLSRDDIDARVFYLQCLADRGLTPSAAGNNNPRPASSGLKLSPEQLDEALAIYRDVAGRTDLVPLNVLLLRGLTQTLVAAEKNEVATQLLTDAASNLSTPLELAYMQSYLREFPDLVATGVLFDRLLELQARDAGGRMSSQYVTAFGQSPRMLDAMFQRLSDLDAMLAVWKKYVRLQARLSVRPAPARSLFGTAAVSPMVSGRANPGMAVAPPGMTSQGQTRIVVPEVPGILLGADHKSTLTVLRRRFELDRRTADLVAAFQRELETVVLAEEKLFWRHSLALLLVYDGQVEAALAQLAEAVKELPDRTDLRLALARQYELASQPAQALEMVKTLRLDEPGEQFELGMMTLRLAMLCGEIDLAATEAERLAGGTVPPQHLEALAGYLMKAGLNESVEPLLIRARQASLQNSLQLRDVMTLQLKHGMKDEAATTATILLSRLNSSPTPTATRPTVTATRPTVANGQVVPVRTALNVSVVRQQCYTVLHAAGRLKEVIESAEQELEGAPGSVPLMKLLISHHQIAGNELRVKELTREVQRREIETLKQTAQSPMAKYTLAVKLFEFGQSGEALAQLKPLVEQDPEFLSKRCRDTLAAYHGKPELIEFATLLEQLDWCKADGSLSAVSEMIVQLHARQPTAELADRLFIKVWNGRVDRRLDLLQRFVDDHWWQLPDVRRDLHSILVPQFAADVSDQWRVFGQTLSSDASVAGLFTVLNRILATSTTEKTLGVLAAKIEQKRKRWPHWTGGAVLLALIDLRRGRVEAGVQALDRLYPAVTGALEANPIMAWEIGQELVRHKEGMDAGAKYFMVAIQGTPRNRWGTASSPGGALISACVQHGRHSEVRRLLLESVPEPLRSGGTSKEAATRLDLERLLSIGRALKSLNYPMDAINVYLPALERLEQAPTGGGLSLTELSTDLVFAFGSLKPESLAEHLEQIDDMSPRFHLNLYVQSQFPEQSWLQTRWVALVSQIARQPELHARTQAALERVGRLQPANLDARVMSVHLWLAAGDQERTAEAVQGLVRYAADRPLPKGGDAPDPAATDEGMQQAALWLIARDCLKQPALAAAGETLGQRAVQASRAANRPITRTILTEWLRIATEAGNAEAVARLKKELDQFAIP